MRLRRLPVVTVCVASMASAQAPEGITFAHRDWELACDTSGTCRAAGYQADDGPQPVSVLLTRAAGPSTPVLGEVTVHGEDEARVSLVIDARTIGEPIVFRPKTTRGALSPEQVTALLEALRRPKSPSIVFRDKATWRLSDKGAMAVLLKMDDVQGRVGTPSALVKPGAADEVNVPGPRVVEPVVAAPVTPSPKDEAAFLKRHRRALLTALRKTTNADDCERLHDPQASPSVTKLNDRFFLVTTGCWLAAYNAGEGVWVVEAQPPFTPRLVTESSNGFHKGELFASHKGRGLGDCWSTKRWTWTGEAFELTEVSTGGMCRGFPGGRVGPAHAEARRHEAGAVTAGRRHAHPGNQATCVSHGTRRFTGNLGRHRLRKTQCAIWRGGSSSS